MHKICLTIHFTGKVESYENEYLNWISDFSGNLFPIKFVIRNYEFGLKRVLWPRPLGGGYLGVIG